MSNFNTAWVTRADSRRYTAGARAARKTGFEFGALVKTSPAAGPVILGLVDEVAVAENLAARQMVAAGLVDDSFRAWNLMDIGVTITGWREHGGTIRYGLPPQPPVGLETVQVCNPAELLDFSRSLTYLPLLLNSQNSRADELAIVHLIRAGLVRPLELRARFVREVGRRLTRHLHRDLRRLEQILTAVVTGIRAAESG